MSKSLKIAILSDLHCHPSGTNPANTVLFSDGLRLPSKEHPVENLIDLINDELLNVDILMCPGDFAHQADRQGLLSGWYFVNEIAKAFGNIPIISTIGNHDVDSRNNNNTYSFHDIKKIGKNFPLESKYLDSFWGNGYSIIDESDYIVLVINSCHFHTHNDGSVIGHGEIDSSQIEMIENSISKYKDDDRIKILLLHHHPVQHERFELGETDFLKNGENLMKIVAETNFDIVIHGHKHDPWLRYYLPKTVDYKLPVLSSGSFSATNQKLYAEIGNYFHVLDLNKENKKCRGKVISYNYRNRGGWNKEKRDFFPYSGFGNNLQISELVSLIKKHVTKDSKLKSLASLTEEINQLDYLTPDEIKKLQSELKLETISIPLLGVNKEEDNMVFYYGK